MVAALNLLFPQQQKEDQSERMRRGKARYPSMFTAVSLPPRVGGSLSRILMIKLVPQGPGESRIRQRTMDTQDKVSLASWRPTWDFQAVKMPNNTGPGSIQHKQGKLVCHNHWFSRHRRLQKVDEPHNLHRCKQEEVSQGSLCSHRNHLECSTSYWNYIDEMYSNIRQGEYETTDKLDQYIKQLVEKCQYENENEKEVCQTELLFHATKHFEVKKWVRQLKECKDITYDHLLEHAKQHECMVKDFNWHKTNGDVVTTATIDEIKTFKPKYKSDDYQGKGSSGRTCGRCDQSHPQGECPAWGKKCHRCGKSNHFSMCCRSRHSNETKDRDHHGSSCKSGKDSWRKRRSWSRPGKCYKSEESEDRSTLRTRSAHKIELESFKNHDEDLHWRHPEEEFDGEPHSDMDLHERQPQNSFQNHCSCTYFVKKTFHTISRSKLVGSISNETDPEEKIKIIMVLQIKLPHRNGINNLRVKVGNGAEANILSLNFFRTMFPHALDKQCYSNRGFLRRPRTNLECYGDSKLTNHTSIELRLQHYSENPFQDQPSHDRSRSWGPQGKYRWSRSRSRTKSSQMDFFQDHQWQPY